MRPSRDYPSIVIEDEIGTEKMLLLSKLLEAMHYSFDGYPPTFPESVMFIVPHNRIIYGVVMYAPGAYREPIELPRKDAMTIVLL